MSLTKGIKYSFGGLGGFSHTHWHARRVWRGHVFSNQDRPTPAVHGGSFLTHLRFVGHHAGRNDPLFTRTLLQLVKGRR